MKLILRILLIAIDIIFLIAYKFMCLIYTNPLNKEFKFCYSTSFGLSENKVVYWSKVLVFVLFAIALIFETKIDSINNKISKTLIIVVSVAVFFIFIDTLLYEYFNQFLLVSSFIFLVVLMIYQLFKLKRKI